MKNCPHCSVLLFSDQGFCYECETTVIDSAVEHLELGSSIEQLIHIKVVVDKQFSYETHLQKREGASLSVGSARDNAIVIPHPDVSDHQLNIFFSHGCLWIEEKATPRLARLNGALFEGVHSLQSGACIELADACLNLVSL